MIVFSNVDPNPNKGLIASPRFIRALFALTALALIVSLLLVLILAASPELHELIHADANHEDHDCAITLFLTGSFDQPCLGSVFLEPPRFETLVQVVGISSEDFVSSYLQRLTVARGPPQRFTPSSRRA